MSEIIIIILLCAAANYILRVTPFIAKIDNIPQYFKRFLDYMPVAALGALILPGILTSFPDNPIAGVAGVIAAAFMSWFVGGMIVPVLASIGITWIVIQYFPL
jgi:branched-subunit amino acid transport protein